MSPLRLWWRSLQARSDWRAASGSYVGWALKYLYRSACRPRLQQRWLQFLYATPQMARVCAAQPRLHERLHRSFVSTHLDRTECYALACSHFSYLLDTWSESLLAAVYAGEGAILAEFRLKNNALYRIQLHVPGGDREGELALALLDEPGRRIAAMTLTIGKHGRTLLIGCVQGSDAGLGREAISDFTRASDGLRPKNLLLSLCYGIASLLREPARIYGISQKAHPYLGVRDRRHGGVKLKSDYDGFWQESGGQPGLQGFFILPASEPKREASELPSKRRAAFLRRETLRREIVAAFVQRLGEQSRRLIQPSAVRSAGHSDRTDRLLRFPQRDI